MLREIWQEIQDLKQDRLFIKNLGLIMMIIVGSFVTLAGEYRHPQRIVQKEKLTQFSTLVSTGIIIRTFDSLLDKEN